MKNNKNKKKKNKKKNQPKLNVRWKTWMTVAAAFLLVALISGGTVLGVFLGGSKFV